MQRKYVFLLIISLLVISSLGYWLSRPAHKDSSGQTATVEVGTIESMVTAQGTLQPKEYVDVGAQVSGSIQKLHVEIGDEVHQGDLIAEIDPDVYKSRVLADEANLKTLQAQKAEQQALVKQAKQKLDRNKLLFSDKAVSKEALEDTQTALEVAQANLHALEAQIEQSQSNLQGDKTNLSYTKIYAPMAGTVVSQSVQEGQTINANQTAPILVQVANLDIMTVKAQVAEADIMKLKPDMVMYFTTLGSQNRRWEGKIRQILPSPETLNNVVLYNVLVDVDNADHQLMTGMTTQMFFMLGKADQVPVIPASALTKRLPASDTDKGQAYEIKVIKDEQPQARTIIIGLSDRSQAEILSGLDVGETILLPSAVAAKPASASQKMPRMQGMGRI